jgi:hypothetical protein
MPYLVGGGGSSGYDFGEMREEIVAATLEEFGGEVGGPVGSVGFEGVGEDGVGWGVAEGFEERFAYGFEMGCDDFVAEGVEDPAFGSYSGSLDDLSGVAGDEEESDAGLVGGGERGAGDWEGLGGGRVPGDLRGDVAASGSGDGGAAADVSVGKAAGLGGAGGEDVDEGCGDEGFAFFEERGDDGDGFRGNGDFCGAEAAGGFGEGGGGASIGPAAAEGDIDAEAEFAAFGLGVADVVEHGGANEGLVDEIFGGVVEDFRVDEGEFGSADAVGFHLLKLAEYLGFFDGGAEPPPAHHGLGVGWRVFKVGLDGFD